MTAFETACFKALLVATAAALLVLAIPDLVVIGFFMLILPGLVLSFMPAVALYGWLFGGPYLWSVRTGSTRTRAALLGLVVMLAVGVGLPMALQGIARAKMALATAGDETPARPLPVGGVVAVIGDKGRDRCDDLCLRLLYNGTARTVFTGVGGKPGKAWTIDRRAVCPPFLGSQNAVWMRWPEEKSRQVGPAFVTPMGLKELVEARIAGGECLVPVSGPIRTDWTIRRSDLDNTSRNGNWSLSPGSVRGERLRIYRSDGARRTEIARYTHAFIRPPDIPLMPSLGGPLESTRWGWNRALLGDNRWDWDSVAALQKLVAFDAALPSGTSPGKMREHLARALSDPLRGRDDAGLLLANSVATDIVADGVQEGDAALIARAIDDDRFTKIEMPYRLAERLGSDYAVLADSAIARMARLPSGDPNTFPHNQLDGIIAQMPSQWFASPPANLLSILSNPVIVARMERTVGKLDAGGAAAVPLLTGIVTRGADHAAEIKDTGYDRHFALEGVDAAVGALCAIGQPARASLAAIVAAKRRVDATSRDWPNRNTGKFTALWKGQAVNDGFVITLVSLGVPIDEFRPPDRPSMTVNNSWQKMILGGVKGGNCRF